MEIRHATISWHSPLFVHFRIIIKKVKAFEAILTNLLYGNNH
jgi:hypothetical protein